MTSADTERVEPRASVGTRGVQLPADLGGTVDVLFDGHRVWSFDPSRDGRAGDDDGTVRVRWPKRLRSFLDGVADVTIREADGDQVWFHEEVRFGQGRRRVAVVNADGHRLSVNHHGNIKPTFGQLKPRTRQNAAAAIDRMMADLRDAGVEPFLACGTLLGAARDGELMRHDCDADLAYVSAYNHPFDILRESWRAENALRDRGWTTTRTGAVFKGYVELEQDFRLGIDVFTSFHLDDTYYMTAVGMGSLSRDAIAPLTTVSLEGRDLPAPRDLDAFLTFTYGPTWRVPDPGFKYEIPRAFTRRFSGWFWGARKRWGYWNGFYAGNGHLRVPRSPSQFAPWVEDHIGSSQRIIDVGAGTGRDALWFTGRGHDVIATDMAEPALAVIQRHAVDRGMSLQTRSLNLNDTFSTLVEGSRLAHEPGVRHIYARLLLESVNPDGRERFWRFASMSQRRSGLTFVEFRTRRNEGRPTQFKHRRWYVDPGEVEGDIAAYGGTVVDRAVGRDLAPLNDENPEICRLVVSWAR